MRPFTNHVGLLFFERWFGQSINRLILQSKEKSSAILPTAKPADASPPATMALMSYRINFHVALYNLTETLTSYNPCSVVWIKDERILFQTLQFPEPIPAFAAGHRLLRYVCLDATRRCRSAAQKKNVQGIQWAWWKSRISIN